MASFPDLRETDFSQSDLHDTETEDAQSHSTQPTRELTPLLIPPDAPQILPEDHTTPQDSFGQPSSPSTPSRRPTPQSSRREFKTPSPPKSLPDLPTPSSSDESEPKPWNEVNTPTGAKERHDYARTATPKPPGGWFQTPGPSRVKLDRADPDLGETSTTSFPKIIDEIPLDPTTPARTANATAQQTKTPKPPGGWFSTPTPADPPGPPQPEKAQGLFTPAPSLSKGSSVDFKTPAVPGGWATTPAARKSILKVRFNPEIPSNESGPTWGEQADDDSSRLAATATQSSASTSSRSEALPINLRSPRKSHTSHTPSIRMVDAFGRVQESNLSTQADANRSRKALRVVDAMGQEIQDIDDTAVQNSKIGEPSSRAELLSRIRQGLDDLVVDLDDVDECARFLLYFPTSLLCVAVMTGPRLLIVVGWQN